MILSRLLAWLLTSSEFFPSFVQCWCCSSWVSSCFLSSVLSAFFVVCFWGVYRHISYLPLAHIYERMNVLVMLHFGVGIGFYQGVISLCPILLFFHMCCVELASSYCSWWCNIVVMGVCSGCTKADGGHWGVKTHYILQCSSPLQSHLWQVKMHPLIPCILSLFLKHQST